MIKDRVAQCVKVLISKGHDYNPREDEDITHNFKAIAAAIKAMEIDCTKPEGAADFFVVHKLIRKWSLLNSGKSPLNESLDDTLLDQLNYTILSEACVRRDEIEDVDSDRPIEQDLISVEV